MVSQRVAKELIRFMGLLLQNPKKLLYVVELEKC